MKPPYVVIGSGSLVEAWSTARLQFEPRDWQRQFRAELGGAASVLVANGQPLRADYRSPVLDSCDTENILFYNVGTSAFAATTAAGLRFERGYVVPPCPVGLASAAQHYHRYELTRSGGAFSLWREEARLASFGPVRLPRLSAASRLSSIWLALREAHAHIDGDAAQVASTFALRLGLRLPSASAAPIGLLKPLLDGVTAAFGAYEGPRLATVSERLAGQVGRDTAVTRTLLTDRSRALLGVNELVVPRSSGVQWQPADDRCVGCELRIERDGEPHATLSGELVAVTRH